MGLFSFIADMLTKDSNLGDIAYYKAESFGALNKNIINRSNEDLLLALKHVKNLAFTTKNNDRKELAFYFAKKIKKELKKRGLL